MNRLPGGACLERRRSVLSLLLFLLAPVALLCEPASAEDLSERFSIYAYLSQAYADAQDHQILGIPTDGTFDYRTAALQLRYTHDDRNSLVIQLSHERNAEDPILPDREEVEVDWLFYQHTFPSRTRVQAGRLPIPFGIFNKIRDVGTILPFYRPYAQVYQEGAFVSETLDGVLVAQEFATGSPWSLEAELYTGEWESANNSGVPVDVEDAIGGQLWLNTPISGFRVGVALQETEVTQRFPAPRGTTVDDFETALFSIEVDREHWLVRAERQAIDFSSGGNWRSWYGQVGIKPTPELGFFGQYGEADLTASIGGPSFVEIPVDEDRALGVRYSFRPEVVVKGEYHWNEGFSAEDLPPFPFLGPTFESNYTILSLSVSY